MDDITRQRKKRERRRRRGERTLQILNILAQGAMATVALMATFAPGTTYSMAKQLRKMPREIDEFFKDAKRKNQFYSLLSYLQKSGLATKNAKGGKIKWQLTQKGQEKKNELERRISNVQTPFLPLPIYKTEKSDKLIAIIFDVPEKENFKRKWFRQTLKSLGFSLVQKSVWMGQIKIPKELVEDLKRMNLLSYIKIFSVVEIGNLD